VELDRLQWTCSLCRRVNVIRGAAATRYESSRTQLPELASPFVEFELDATAQEFPVDDVPLEHQPIHVALVDMSGDSEYVAAVQVGLQALLEALPRDARFALVTFSDKVGVMNFNCSVPHTSYVRVHADATSAPQPALSRVLPLRLAAVPLHSHDQRVSLAISSLVSSSASHSGERRAFGAALDLVLDFVLPESSDGELLNVRVSCFLAGGVNYGLGSAGLNANAAAAPVAAIDDADLLRPLTAFFRTRAERAAHCGATIDLVLVRGSTSARSVAAAHFHLPSIKFLSTLTGGAILQYGNSSEASSALPFDLFRLLTQPRAYHGALRVRTSPDMAVANAYGELIAARSADGGGLFTLPSCSAESSVAFDFKFTNPVGFVQQQTVVIQVAFAHSVRVEHADKATVSVRRRLRLWTIQVDTSESAKSVHASVDAQQVLQLLVAKVVRASLDAGLHAARLLLQDWLVVLLMLYNEQRSRSSANDVGIDVAFMQCEALKPLPRWVFALSRSALLLPPPPPPTDAPLAREAIADGAVLLQSRLASLAPAALQTAVYPRLAAYSTMQKMLAPSVHLSQAAVHANAASARVYVVDRFLDFFVFYTALGVGEALPFPPPKGSLIRQPIESARRTRAFVPRVVYARADIAADARAFADLLIEESAARSAPDAGAVTQTAAGVEIRVAMVSATQSFLQFIDGVTQEVDKLARQADRH
jgi:hypothetical protein